MEPNEKTVIVLTGSFNPPTKAHSALLVHALDSTGAGRGVFVPANDKYVERKLRRNPDAIAFREEERVDMLRAIAGKDPRLDVRGLEHDDDGRGHTYQTMLRARDYYGCNDCRFLLGADKLRILPRWRSIDRFLRNFRFVVTSRGDVDAEAVIRNDPLLSAHADRFTVIPGMPGMGDVSSSRFQAMFRGGDPKAMDLLDPTIHAMVRICAGGRANGGKKT